MSIFILTTIFYVYTLESTYNGRGMASQQQHNQHRVSVIDKCTELSMLLVARFNRNARNIEMLFFSILRTNQTNQPIVCVRVFDIYAFIHINASHIDSYCFACSQYTFLNSMEIMPLYFLKKLTKYHTKNSQTDYHFMSFFFFFCFFNRCLNFFYRVIFLRC